jgi:CubicO group peptidase (beta-lactamase class C family)
MKRSLVLGAIVLILAALVFSWMHRRPDPRRSSEKAAAQVDALMAPWSKGETPGAAVIVIRDGQILLKKGYGMANLEQRRPIDPDTAFLLCSVTKQFTAMAIMILAERGKLRYDDALSSFFPEFPPYAQAVTLRHLLHHTAGFPEYDSLFLESGAIDQFWPRSAKSRSSRFEPTSKDVLRILAQQKELAFAPGERWEYSNSGYVILAQVVEKVTGQTFAQFLQQEIFQPLGMKRSRLYDETRPTIEKRATSYKTGANGRFRDIDYAPQNAVYGEDNIYTTIEDMYAWDQALYTETLVRAATLREAFTPGRLKDGTATRYGFGWGTDRALGREALAHGGAWLGFRTYILRFPAQKFTVVVLSNLSEFQPDTMATEISRIYLEGNRFW